jgi:hypothetical protein
MSRFTNAICALHDALLMEGPVDRVTVRVDFETYWRVRDTIPPEILAADTRAGGFRYDGIRIEHEAMMTRPLSIEIAGLLSEVG